MIHLRKKQNMEGLAALLLLTVFAACVLLVLLFGADAYGRLNRRDQISYNHRTAVQYIATRLRQADTANNITLEDFQGVDALVFEGDGQYITRLYCYDGALRELYSPADLPMTPADGEQILAVEHMTLDLQEGLLQVTLTDFSGRTDYLTLSLRSGEEVVQ